MVGSIARIAVLAAVCATAVAEPTIFDQLSPISESQYKANAKAHKLKSRIFEKKAKRDSSTAAFSDFVAKEAPAPEAPEDMRFASAEATAQEKADSRAQAMHNDHVMYGGKTFTPPEGHEMHFDFDTFARYSMAQHAQVQRQMKAQGQQDLSDATSLIEVGAGNVIQKSFLQACLEINVCTIMPDVAGTPNVCGMFGIDGVMELEKEGADQKLTLKVGLNAGISWGVTGAFATTLYLFGEAAFEFKIKGPVFANVYDAVFGAIRSMITEFVNTRKLNSKFMMRALDARDQLVKDEAGALGVAPTQVQLDELTGMVAIHYDIMRTIIADSASLPPSGKMPYLQKMIALAFYKHVWGYTDAKVLGAIKTDTKKQGLDTMLNSPTFKSGDLGCSDLNKGAKLLGVDNVLFCSMLKYGVMIPQKDLKRGGIFSQGSRENCQKSLPVLYKEIWPLTEDQAVEIVDRLKEWATDGGGATITPADLKAYVDVTMWIEPDEGGAAPFQVIKKTAGPKAAMAGQYDPCTTARGMFQAMAMSSKDLEARMSSQYAILDGKAAPKHTFALQGITLQGGLGVTLGSARVGYCTADSNWFQARLTYAREWTKAAGWAKKGMVNLWLVGSTGSYFRVEATVGLYNKSDGDNPPFKFKLVFSLPQGGTDTVLDTSTAVTHITSVAEFIAGMGTNIWTALKAGDKAAKKLAFQNAMKTLISKNRVDGVANLLPGKNKVGVQAELLKNGAAIVAAAFVQAGVKALLKIAGFELSSYVTAGAEWTWKGGTKHAIQGELAVTRVFKISFGAGSFYLLQGTSATTAAKEFTVDIKATPA